MPAKRKRIPLIEHLENGTRARAPYRDSWFEQNIIRVEDGEQYKEETVVLISGGFDILHTGILTLITCARKTAEQLANEIPWATSPIVLCGLYSDRYLSERDPDRPYLTWVERQAQLGRIGGIDAVVEVDTDKQLVDFATLSEPLTRVVGANDTDNLTPWIPFTHVRRNSDLTSTELIKRIRSR